jgi:hypothetical protein
MNPRGAAVTRGGWVYIGGHAGNKPVMAERAAVTSACERFIAVVLKPRFLSEIRPTEFEGSEPLAPQVAASQPATV